MEETNRRRTRHIWRGIPGFAGDAVLSCVLPNQAGRAVYGSGAPAVISSVSPAR